MAPIVSHLTGQLILFFDQTKGNSYGQPCHIPTSRLLSSFLEILVGAVGTGVVATSQVVMLDEICTQEVCAIETLKDIRLPLWSKWAAKLFNTKTSLPP
jgi:hypothetical protein